MTTSAPRDFMPPLAALAILTFALHIFSNNDADVDLWGNVGFVNALPSQPEFHYTNTYSFTEPDTAWINHEWLAEYLMHQAHALAGNQGLLTLKLTLGFILLAVLHVTIRATGTGGLVRFLWLLLTISTLGYGFSTRPHHFTYLMLAALLYALRFHAKSFRILLPATIPFAALWANLHGAFFIGLVTILAFATGRALDALTDVQNRREALRSAALLLCAAALFVLGSLLNPYGIRLWGFIRYSASLPRPYLSEWHPFDPAIDLLTHADFTVLAILSVITLALATTRRSTAGNAWTVLTALALAAALVLRRNIPLFAIVACFAVPQHLELCIGKPLQSIAARIPRKALATVLLAFTALSIHSLVFFNKTNFRQIEVDPAKFPISAIQFIQEHQLTGNLLAFFDWAEYCIWHLHPQIKVFLDGRFESAYSPQTIQDYISFIYQSGNTQAAITNYPTDMLLLHRGNPASTLIAADPGWQLTHQTDISLLFVRTNSAAFARIQSGTKPTTHRPAASRYFP